jgi:hypothetical protein
MSALEKEIFDKVSQLNESQQRQVLEFLQTIETTSFNWQDWLEQVEAFQTSLKAKYGEQHYFGTQDLLDELREEASWPRRSSWTPVFSSVASLANL